MEVCSLIVLSRSLITEQMMVRLYFESVKKMWMLLQLFRVRRGREKRRTKVTTTMTNNPLHPRSHLRPLPLWTPQQTPQQGSGVVM